MMSKCKKEGCSRETCLINGDFCSSTCWIVGLEKDNTALVKENARLRSLVEATETDLFDQKKKRRRLEKRWSELGEWIDNHKHRWACGDETAWDEVIDKMEELQAGSK